MSPEALKKSAASMPALESFALEAFDYALPSALIAQTPLAARAASRLLVLDDGVLTDRHFAELPALLRAGDLLVFNDTRVIAARLCGHKQSGGRVEFLVERALDDRRVLAQARASKALRPGARVQLEGGVVVRVLARQAELYELYLECAEALPSVLERIGRVPLPPYIRREPGPSDRERYQTVYAAVPGAVAAPTAGLHFDADMFRWLAAAGIETAFLTLHVGAGTFAPVRARDVRAHRMHPERVAVGVEVCEAVKRARARGGRVIAVGTTVVRALESAVRGGGVRPFTGETALYIWPGYRFQAIDAMLTNFHLPRSSLLILVCAFAGTVPVLKAYRHAVARRYRFFSYGDAMLVIPRVASGK